MNNSMKMGLVKAITLFSILIALSGMAAIASAADDPPMLIANLFYGNVTLNGADASPETVINAYIDEELRGSSENEVGSYYIDVEGNGSVDSGKVITFTVCGADADQTAVWLASYQSRPLDLTAVDDEAPAVTNADATPSSIVANGVDTTQLTVTVIDGCGVGTVTVNLSAIGGSEAQVMASSGGDMYSTDTSASVDTPPRTYCLQVNASDVFGNYDNMSVCIGLNVTTPGLPQTGDIDDDGDVDLFDAIHLAKYATGAGSDKFRTIHADGDIDDDGDVDLFDAIHLAKYATGAGSDKFRTIYP